MPMTEEEKGYHCPSGENGINCENCELKTTKCIVYSKAGKQRYMDWLHDRSKKAQEAK